MIEHKSYPERWVSLDLLRYAVEIWRTWLKGAEKEKDLRLPALVPLVLYHGSEEWAVPRNVTELIAAPAALARYRPRFRYELLNLADVTDESLPAGVVSRAALLALKYCLRPEIRERVTEILRVLTALEQEPGGLDYIRTLLSYLVITARDLEAEQLRGAIETSFRMGDEIMPTIAEQWIQEGKREGKREGEGVVVERLLRRRFGPLPTWAMERLAGAEPEVLEEWAERLLDATSLEGVFGEEARVN